MKKSIKYLFAFATLFATPLTMTACGGVDPEIQEKLETALGDLELASTVESNFTLEVEGIANVQITWTSSDPDVISIDGVNANVSRGDTDQEVTLTATATLDGVTETRTFTVTVKGIDLSNYDIISVAEAKAAADDTPVVIRGVVSRGYPYLNTKYNEIYWSGTYITDNTGTVHLYGSKFAEEVAPGTEVVVSAVKTNYYGSVQLKTPTAEVILGTGKTMPLNNVIEGTTIAEILAVNDDVENIANNVYKLTGHIGINTGTDSETGEPYKSYYFQDGNNQRLNIYFSGSAASIPQFEWMDPYVNKEITVAFVINSSNSNGKWRGHIIHIYE